MTMQIKHLQISAADDTHLPPPTLASEDFLKVPEGRGPAALRHRHQIVIDD